MKSIFFALFLGLLVPTVKLSANELDLGAQLKIAQRHAVDLPQTLVVRTNKLDGTVAVHHSPIRIPETSAPPKNFTYLPMKSIDRLRNALDRSNSGHGWYFYWYAYSYFQPAYRYYDFNYYYHPYHTVFYHPYTYTYYCWCPDEGR